MGYSGHKVTRPRSILVIIGGMLAWAGLVGGVLIDRIGLPRTVASLGAGLLISMALILTLPETKGMDLVRARRTGSRTTTTGS